MKTAVISGGAGGLGQAPPISLPVDGWRVVLIDLDVSGLEVTQTQVPMTCELTDAAQLGVTMAEITDRFPRIDLAVYNAGITQIGAIDATDDVSHRKVFEINCFAAVAMARHQQDPVRAAKGTHLAISSVAGFSPLYHRTAHAAPKHALKGFFKSLRSEEKAHGVQTLIAAPPFVATNIGNDQRQDDGAACPGSATDGMDYVTPETAAAEILNGLQKARPMIPVGRIARATRWFNSLARACSSV